MIDQLADWLLGDVSTSWWKEGLRLVRLWGPVVSIPGIAAPVGLVSSVLALAILSGVALAAFSVFLTAVIAAYLLLTEILGFSVELIVS
jgi:hypothetical protein